MDKKKKYFKPTNDLSYSKLLELYADISNNVYEKNADFVLPQNLKFSAFGNKIAFCQLINTWFSQNPYSKVRIYDNYFPVDNLALEKTINILVQDSELPTLLTLAYGTQTNILGYSNKTHDYTPRFIGPLQRKIVQSYKELTRVNEDEFLGNEFFQLHPDFLGDDFFAKNQTFYLKAGNEYYIRTKVPILESSERLFKRIEKVGTQISSKKIREIQTYFYEIFDNTYQWGRQNWLNKDNEKEILSRSNRLFFISSKTFVNLDKNSGRFSNLDKDLLKFAMRNKHGSDTKLLELSILDNGIGIVQAFKKDTFKNKRRDITEEYDFLLESFELGATSDPTSKSNIRGIGLNEVIRKINDVFLIIRTGHLFLFRDFGANPFRENESFYLSSVSLSSKEPKNDITNIEKHPWAQGTLFTFIIPM